MLPSVIEFEGLKIHPLRYAVYCPHPWSQHEDSCVEIACLDCRKDGLPVTVGRWDKTAMLTIMLFISRHEKKHHPRPAAVAA